MDVISLRGLKSLGHHGVLHVEKQHGQRFVVDVDLFVERFGRVDRLENTVDYAAVAADIEELVSGQPVALIETLAARIADACLSYELVRRVRVTVHKPQAPVRSNVADISVTIERP
ncbi:MAG: dihydroneopterin aldolase [Actinobacteria bacterium]|nr:dihydroneopterin aldolase [Actinomycetota bacterium]